MNHTINYQASYHSVDLCPKSSWPEFAFIGRSNVGKSSLINSLFGRKELAYVSKQPGKTQSINYYSVDDKFYIVDLPGYGYAKHSKAQRARWDKMSKRYFLERSNLECVFVLIDSNIPPQVVDMEFIDWLGENQIPFVLVYTKSDRSKPLKIDQNIAHIQETLLQNWEYLPEQFVTSSVKGDGIAPVLKYLFKLAEDLSGNEGK